MDSERLDGGSTVSVEFNHTLVHAKDIWAAAREVGGLLGLAEPSSYGPFAVLQFDNGTTLDFVEDTRRDQRPALRLPRRRGRLRRDLEPPQGPAPPVVGRPAPAPTRRDQPRRRRSRPLLGGTGRALAGDHHPPVRQRRLSRRRVRPTTRHRMLWMVASVFVAASAELLRPNITSVPMVLNSVENPDALARCHLRRRDEFRGDRLGELQRDLALRVQQRARSPSGPRGSRGCRARS